MHDSLLSGTCLTWKLQPQVDVERLVVQHMHEIMRRLPHAQEDSLLSTEALQAVVQATLTLICLAGPDLSANATPGGAAGAGATTAEIGW